MSQRRWWLSQWAQGEAFVDGLVAQDVQDALFDEARRWPVCSGCPDPVEHSLSIEPELGPDPHWVCSESGSSSPRWADSRRSSRPPRTEPRPRLDLVFSACSG